MPSPTTSMLVLQAVVEHVRQNEDWIVVVTPEKEAESLAMAAVALSPRALFCGRTVMFPSGGRLTIPFGDHPLYGEGFRVLFVGFESSCLPSDEIALHIWRNAAVGLVTVGTRPGELRFH